MRVIAFRRLLVAGLVIGVVTGAPDVMAVSPANPGVAGRANDCFCGHPATGGDHCFVSTDCDGVADCGPGDTCPPGEMCLQHDGTHPNCCERKVCVPLCGASCVVGAGRGTCTNDPPTTTFDICPVIVDTPAGSRTSVLVLTVALVTLTVAGLRRRRRARA